MSVQTEIDRIAGNVTAALAACADKGADVPSGSTSDDLAAIIAAIEAGGGGGGPFAAWGTYTPAEDQTSTTFDTGCKINASLSSYLQSNSLFVLWKNSKNRTNGSYLFLMWHSAASGQCYTYGVRPGGSVYNSNTSTAMNASMPSSNGTVDVTITVTGDTTANFTYGLVAGVEYCWGWVWLGDEGEIIR